MNRKIHNISKLTLFFLFHNLFLVSCSSNYHNHFIGETYRVFFNQKNKEGCLDFKLLNIDREQNRFDYLLINYDLLHLSYESFGAVSKIEINNVELKKEHVTTFLWDWDVFYSEDVSFESTISFYMEHENHSAVNFGILNRKSITDYTNYTLDVY